MKIRFKKENQRKITLADLFLGIAILFISFYVVLPYFTENFRLSIPVPVSLALTLIITLLHKRFFYSKDLVYFVFVIAWFLWFSLCIGSGGSTVPRIYSTMLLSNALVFLCALPLAQESTKNSLRSTIITLICISIIITVLISLPYIEINPYIIREMATDVNLYKGLGIGGYEFSYSVALLVPCLLLSIKSSKKWEKILSIATLVAVCIYTTMCALFTTLLMVIAGVSLFFVLQIKSKNLKIFLVSLLVIILIFMALFGFEVLADSIESINSMIDNEIINAKLNDIVLSMRGGEEEYGTLSGRTSRYEISLKSFAYSPLVGGMIIGNSNTSGGHSMLFDYLAMTGIIGTALFLYLIFKVYQTVSLRLHNKMSKSVLWESFAVFLAVALIKGTNYMTLFWTFLVVIPMFIKYSDNAMTRKANHESVAN